LFVDNPVGAGYSYVDSDDAFTTDVSMIAADMMVLLTSFFNNPAGKNFQVCTTLKTF
jgi:carboxypeptidase C (cathepsin A)